MIQKSVAALQAAANLLVKSDLGAPRTTRTVPMSRIRHDAVAKQLGNLQAQGKRQGLKYLRNPGMGQLPEGQEA